MVEQTGDSWASLRGAKLSRRHPCEVTADRLGDHMNRWPDAFTGEDRDKVAEIRFLLQQIADGEAAS